MNKIKIFFFLISIEIISSLLSNQNLDSKKEEIYHCRRFNSSQCLTYKMESKGFNAAIKI